MYKYKGPGQVVTQGFIPVTMKFGVDITVKQFKKTCCRLLNGRVVLPHIMTTCIAIGICCHKSLMCLVNCI